MKKHILFLLIALLPVLSIAQPYPNYQGTATQATIYNGTLGALRGIKIPHLDSSKNYNWYSDIYLNKTTGKLMYRDSVLGKDVVVADAGSILSKDSSVFTGTLSEARQLTISPPALVISDYGGGTWVKDDTVTVDNTGTQIITTGGQGYRRVYDLLLPEYFGAKGDSVTNDSLAFVNTINYSSSTKEFIYLSDDKKYDARIEVTDKNIYMRGYGTLLQQIGRVGFRAVGTFGSPIRIITQSDAIVGPITGKPSPARTETVTSFTVDTALNIFKSGDIYQLSSEDYYSWSEQVLGTGKFCYKTEFVEIGGVAYDYNISGSMISETSIVLGNTSGAKGIIISSAPYSGDTTARLIFNSVSGNFLNGETISVNGVNRGTISTNGYIIIHGRSFDKYTINPVLRKASSAEFIAKDFTLEPVGNVDSIVGSSNRQILFNIRGLNRPQIQNITLDKSWGRGLQVSNCYGGKIDINVYDLPNIAVTAESAYGYGVELYGGSQSNVITINAHNVRHGYTENPSENSNIYANVNIARVGVPKFNVIQNSNVFNPWSAGFDTHEGSFGTTFINCNVYNSYGLYKVVTGTAAFNNRSLSTNYINCTANGSLIGFLDATGAYTIDRPSTTQYINCRALNYQWSGFSQRTSYGDSLHRFKYDNCYASADTATQNIPYYQIGFDIMSGNTQLSNCKADNFNGVPGSLTGGTFTNFVNDNFLADYSFSPSNASGWRFVTGSSNIYFKDYSVIKNKNTNTPSAFFRNNSGTNNIILSSAKVLNDTATMAMKQVVGGAMTVTPTDNQFQLAGVSLKVLGGSGKRTPLDSDFEGVVNNGTIAYTLNTTDNKLRSHIKVGASWISLTQEDSLKMDNSVNRDSATQAFRNTAYNNAYSASTPINAKGFITANPANQRGSLLVFERRASATDFTSTQFHMPTGPSDTNSYVYIYTNKSSDGVNMTYKKVDRLALISEVYNKTQSDAKYALKDSVYSKSQLYTKSETDSAITSKQVFAKNGIRKQGDTVKLGLDMSNPLVGSITEDTYIGGGDYANTDFYGFIIEPLGKHAIIMGVDYASGKQSNLITTSQYADLHSITGLGKTGILTGDDEVLINSDVSSFQGAKYNTDFSSNYTDRSIPDVEWVKGFTDTASSIGKTYTGSTSISVAGDSIIRAALTGDVTATANSNALTISNSAVSNAKLRASVALSVIGRSSNSSGVVADIAAATDGHVLRRNGANLGFGTIATSGISDAAITAIKIDPNAIKDSVVSITASTTITTAQYGNSGGLVIAANATSGAITVTLPTAATTLGRTIYVKKTDNSANSVTVRGAGGTELIDDSTTYILSTGNQSVIIKSNATKNLTF